MKLEFAPPREIAIYVLHFAQPIQHVQHYVGSCALGRLHLRMREHQNGNGAALTKRFAELGIPFTLAQVYVSQDRKREYAIKRHGNQKKTCPLCNAKTRTASHALVGTVYVPPILKPEQKVLSFS